MMSEKRERLEARVREYPLKYRLERCREMIGQMCSEHRCPKMSIPVDWDDEDFYIVTTLKDAIDALAATRPAVPVETLSDLFEPQQFYIDNPDALDGAIRRHEIDPYSIVMNLARLIDQAEKDHA